VSINQPLHLYTIWRYDHNPDTIIDHKEILADHGSVKWLVLYSDEDKKYFEQSLPVTTIRKISRQAKDVETILFIQCLEHFRSQIYAGLIRKITISAIKKIKDDKLVPGYYKELLENKNLRVLCTILLSKLEPIDANEVNNLISTKINIPIKRGYNLTRIVYQDRIRDIFKEKSKIIGELRTDQIRKERSRAIAELIWRTKPEKTIADLIQSDEINGIACEGKKNYTKKVLRNWIKDLCPDRSKGRRPMHKLVSQ
jgi:hypothetical protein